MTSKVLVTGGAGYIGAHTAYCLMDAGYEVFVLDDLSNSSKICIPNGVSFKKGDVGDRRLVEGLLGENEIEAVLHFAGSIVVPESVEEPHLYYKNNTIKSHSLIGSCLNSGVKHFIFSSSAAVYGTPQRIPVREKDRTDPINPYGSSKLMVERMLQDICNVKPFRYMALRYFNVAGADPKGRCGQRGENMTHLVKVAVETALGKRPEIQIFGNDYDTRDGTCIRDFIHVSDLAAAHLSALRYLEGGGESAIINCGYGQGYSVKEVLKAVERAAGKELKKSVVARRAGDAAEVVASTDKIRLALDWEPCFNDIDAIVASALDWEKTL